MQDKKKDIFTTQDGVEIELLPISQFEIQAVADALKEQHPVPPVPTYEVTTIGGGKEFHQHTADTLDTPESKAQWKEYDTKKTLAENAINLAINDYLFMAGLQYVMPTNDGAWMKLQKRFGVKIPDDPDDLKLHYLKTRLLSPDDLSNLLPRLMSKTGVDPKLVETAKNSFRRSVRRQGRQENRSVDAETEGQVVDSTEVLADEDGESVGSVAG